jgi:hypothetical protein
MADAYTLEITPPVAPGKTDVQIMQRPIEVAYGIILSYDASLLAHDPDQPRKSILKTVAARHGYYTKTIFPNTTPPGDMQGDEQAAE